MSDNNSILLTRLFLKIDFRSRDKAGLGRLAGLIVTYLFANTLIANNNFLRLDKQSFVFASLTVNLFFVAFIIVSDYAQLFFDRKHTGILSVLPLKQQDVFSAKVASAFAYLSVFPLIVSLPPSVYVYFYDKNPLDCAEVFISSVLFAYFITALVLLSNSIVVYIGKGKNKILIYIFQILFVLFVFSMNSITGRMSAGNSIAHYSFLKYFPHYYLTPGEGSLLYLTGFFLLTAVVFAVTYFYLRNKYSALSEIIGSVDVRKKSVFSKLGLYFDFGAFENFILRNSSEKASYGLIKNLFANNTSMKLRFFPVLLIPVISSLIGVVSGIPSMLIMNDSDVLSENGLLVLSPAVTITTIMCIRLLYANTKMALDSDGNVNWIYDSIPVERRKFLNGIVKFIYVYFVFPVLVIVSLLLIIRLPAEDVLLNVFYLAVFGIFVNSLMNRFDKTYPFSVEITKYNNSSKYLEILIVIFFGIVFFVSQIFIFKNIIFVLLTAAVLAVISYFLNK